MAMQRRGRVRATTLSRTQAFVGMAAAALLLVAVASDAFVTAVQPPVMQKPAAVSAVLQRTSRAPAQEQATGLLRTAAATALLCLAMTSARRGSKASPKVRVQAIMSNSVAATVEAYKTPCQVVEQAALLDLSTPETPAIPAIPIIMEAVSVQETEAVVATPVSVAPVAKQHHKARMVGQSRRCTHRSAHSARSAFARAKQARRTSGKSLQARVQPVPVAQASFDPSTVRNSVQIGLRISSTLRSEKGRESKSPSSLEGSDMSTGLRIQANEFRE